MKATELMINDWIQIDEPDRYAGAIGQIKSLLHHKDEDSAYFHVFIQGTHGYVMREVCSDDIRPIQLQKVHLVKNGFEADEDDYAFTFYDGYEIMVIYEDDFVELGVEPCFFININFAEKHIGMEVEYVHQLQHAMQLMGCDKEIEL